MARAQAIESTATVRDSGVSQRDYEIAYSQHVGRPLVTAEKEVIVLAYATPGYSPQQLLQIAINGCQRFLR